MAGRNDAEIVIKTNEDEQDDGVVVDVEDRDDNEGSISLKAQAEVGDDDVHAADVRNSTNKMKMVPSEGLQTKLHGAASATDDSKKLKGSGRDSASVPKEQNPFVWGPQPPQTRTSIKKVQKTPEKKIDDKNLEYIPCLYLPCEDGGNKVVIYFHGNAEDIGLAFDLLYMFGAEM